MKVLYFPGCTLTNKAKGLNETAKQCLKILGTELSELENWYCCQANFSMLTDNLMNHLAPVRTLILARKQANKLVVLCSTCYYVLKRINYLMEKDEKKRKTVFDFLEEEYKGPIEVIHFLELLKNEVAQPANNRSRHLPESIAGRVGFSKLREKVKFNLKDMAVAPYYGCQLLRPHKELAFDDPENPTIFEKFLEALGCNVIDYPFKTECCGAFLTISEQEAVEDCVLKILKYAIKNGAETITTSCPLCNFNLDWSQDGIAAKYEEFKKIPVLYLSELMALSLGVEITQQVWEEHIVDPRPFLESKGYLINSLSPLGRGIG